MENDAVNKSQDDNDTHTEIQFLGLSDLLLDSYPDDSSPVHPRREAYRSNQFESSAREIPLPSGTSFPPDEFRSHEERQKAMDDAMKAKQDHEEAQKVGYAPYASTIWSSPGLEISRNELPEDQSWMTEPCSHPKMDPKKFEFNVIHERIMALCSRSRDVPRYGCPRQTVYPHKPENRCLQHIAWRNRVIEVWKDSRFSRVRACNNADSFHSQGTGPCKWGWGKIFYEYSWAYTQEEMENHDLVKILEWFHRSHAGEEKFNGVE